METCKECNQDFKSRFALSRHLARHKMDHETYFIKHMGGAGVCVKCSKPTKFRGLWEGYPRTCGHSCGNALVFDRIRNDPERYKQFRAKMTEVVKKEWATNPNMRWGGPCRTVDEDHSHIVMNERGCKNLERIFFGEE